MVSWYRGSDLNVSSNGATKNATCLSHLALSTLFPGPKMVAVRNYHGTPAPPGKTPLCFQTGEFIELLKGDPDTTWWEVQQRNFNLKYLKYIPL